MTCCPRTAEGHSLLSKMSRNICNFLLFTYYLFTYQAWIPHWRMGRQGCRESIKLLHDELPCSGNKRGPDPSVCVPGAG